MLKGIGSKDRKANTPLQYFLVLGEAALLETFGVILQSTSVLKQINSLLGLSRLDKDNGVEVSGGLFNPKRG